MFTFTPPGGLIQARAQRQQQQVEAQIRNLWVERRRRELNRVEEVWTCICGWRFYEIIRGKGPICEKCGKPADCPREHNK